MTAIDRRAMLVMLLSGAAVSTVGLALIPDTAESAPLIAEPNRESPANEFIERTQSVVRRHRYGFRTRRCWHKNGRKVCRRG